MRTSVVQISMLVALWLLMAASAASDDSSPSHMAAAVRGRPVIDGQVDEIWDSAPRLAVAKPVVDMLTIPAKQAARGTARILWDPSALFVLFEVADTNLTNSVNDPWEQDSVEVFVDENHGLKGVYENDDFHCRGSSRGLKTGGANYSPAKVQMIASKTDEGYLVEMALRWRTIRPQSDHRIGLDLQINDDAGAGRRQSIMKWNSPTNQSWHNTSQHGTLILRDNVSAAEITAAAKLAEEALLVPDPVSTAVMSAEQQPGDKMRYAVPVWVAGAVFYQIFPERFRNGDPSNDPDHASLEFPDLIPSSWAISNWTGDWYARAPWERESGSDFYENGVFNRRYGGDLQGVWDKLDYLQDLGINAIYFNPVFYARSLHKYDGNSFHHVDPHFGPDPRGDFALMATETSDPETWKWTAADRLFLNLLAETRRRGIRVIIDGVFNHCGRDFFAFDDLRRNQQQSRYKDWYVVKEYDDPATAANEFKYDCWWGVDTLPNFAEIGDAADMHPGPKQYIFNATRRWMDPNGDGDPSDGLDGWRLDVANELPNKFWVDWHQLVKSINPEAYTVAEIWTDARAYLAATGFTATMNYHGFAFPAKGFLVDGRMPPSKFVEELSRRRDQYPPATRFALQNLIDSHDTDRVASMIVNAGRDYLQPDRFDYDVGERVSARNFADYLVSKPTEKQLAIQRLVTIFQMTYVGAPMIYYGTEAGMWGGDDPDDRKPMIWSDLTYDDETHHPRGNRRPADVVEFDRELFKFYQQAISVRNDHAPLRRGSFQVLLADDVANVLIYERKLDQQRLIVAINRSDEWQKVAIPGEDRGPLRGVLMSNKSASTVLSGDDGEMQLSLSPLAGAVYSVAD